MIDDQPDPTLFVRQAGIARLLRDAGFHVVTANEILAERCRSGALKVSSVTKHVEDMADFERELARVGLTLADILDVPPNTRITVKPSG
jgi:hypothetical protein